MGGKSSELCFYRSLNFYSHGSEAKLQSFEKETRAREMEILCKEYLVKNYIKSVQFVFMMSVESLSVKFLD